MSHYDRDVDIAALDLDGFEGTRAVGEEHEWGLVLRDRDSDRVVGFEIWRASERLPAELIQALPKPRPADAPVERQTA